MAGSDRDATGSVLLIDDHPLVRDALRASLSAAGFDPDALHGASGLSEALPILESTPIDLVLLDLDLGDSRGLDGLSKLRTAAPELRIIIVSAHEDPSVFSRARELGADGYVPKSAAGTAIAQAARDVLAGETIFPEATPETDPDSPVLKMQTLTPAQRRVATHLGDGLLNKQIAYEMGISEATVKAHMTAIFRKLGVSNRTQALLVLNEAVRA